MAGFRDKRVGSTLDRIAPLIHRIYGDRKQAVLGSIRGTIVELGAGAGANLRYYAPGVEVIAIEPNTEMHPIILERAARHGVNVDIRGLRGEQLPLDDHRVDGAVATLVLCSVDDPAQVLDEIYRVLKPGAQLFLLDHVVAPPRTVTRLLQRLAKWPHRWVAGGCMVDRDTAATVHASRFGTVDLDAVDIGWRGVYLRHHIVGTATKSIEG